MRAGYTVKGGAAMSPEAWLPVAFILGYLLGSIPFGLVLTKLAGTKDLRAIGSGNTGATNVLRTGRKGLAAATLLQALAARAQHVGGADIAGADGAQILRACQFGQDQPERDRPEEIAEDEGHRQP